MSGVIPGRGRDYTKVMWATTLLLICGQDNYVVQRNLAIGITAFNNFLRHISSEVWVDIVPHVVPLVRRAQKIGGSPQCLMVVSCTSRPGLLRAVVWSKL